MMHTLQQKAHMTRIHTCSTGNSMSLLRSLTLLQLLPSPFGNELILNYQSLLTGDHKLAYSLHITLDLY